MERIPITRPFFEEDIADILGDVRKILKTGRLILGPYTERFEKEFADYIGVKHAIAVNSCTTALTICMRYFGVEGKEVIIPTNTFISSPNSVIFEGGRPVLADMDPDTLCITSEEVRKRISGKTRGVMAVHIAGLVCPQIKEIKEICEDNNLFLLEDAAHANGATIDSKKAGSLGDAGCFSFYPTKIITTMTGGIITTNDSKLNEFARSLRHFGEGKKREVIEFGNDWVMSEISACLGIYQLKRLDDYIKRRNEIAKLYTKHISKMDNIKSLPVPANVRHSYYRYATLLSKDIDVTKLAEALKRRGIDTGSVYNPPCHLQPLYKKLFGFREGMFPVADDILPRILCLPVFIGLKDEEIGYITDCLKEELENDRNHSSG